MTDQMFEDSPSCWQQSIYGQWEGWGFNSQFEPSYANDDERQEARRRNKKQSAKQTIKLSVFSCGLLWWTE